jgi:hypothetical protein
MIELQDSVYLAGHASRGGPQKARKSKEAGNAWGKLSHADVASMYCTYPIDNFSFVMHAPFDNVPISRR